MPKVKKLSKQAAKRLVCRAAAAILDNDGENEYLYSNQDGDEWDEISKARLWQALRDLVAELERRGGDPDDEKSA